MTQIICTIGPASSKKEILEDMKYAGMDVARLNFSHGNHRSHQAYIDTIEKVNTKLDKKIKILQDLEGYRIRIGKLKQKEGIQLKKKERIFLSNVAGVDEIIPFDYQGSLDEIEQGNKIYIDDGKIELEVIRTKEEFIEAEVTIPGRLMSNKGVNIPKATFKIKGIKEKDRNDIKFGIENNVDFIAQSFVRTKDDILNLRKIIGNNSKCSVIAKIECKEGIKNIDEIIDVSDGIMIARGDMGVSIPIYQVPIVQKMIIKKCNKENKFVITATQMLDSMTFYHKPTRAEVSDVSNAVIDGTDFVMLSGETAVGKYPKETVAMMQKIIDYTKNNVSTLV